MYTYAYAHIYIYIYTSVIPCISMHGVKWNSCAVQLSTVMPRLVSLHCNFERQVASKACLSSASERPVASKACPSSHFERQVASKACPSSHFERQVAPAQQIAVF